MGVLDAIVSMAFRDEPAGRVVVFSGDRRKRGYVVRSEAEELKIKSFLKMFYFAHFYILILGMSLANAWSTFVIHMGRMGRPEGHLVRNMKHWSWSVLCCGGIALRLALEIIQEGAAELCLLAR